MAVFQASQAEAMSKAAFWQMIRTGEDHGYIQESDILVWGEWDAMAFNVVAYALFFPHSLMICRMLAAEALANKTVTAAELLSNVKPLLQDLWKDEPGKAEYFFDG